MSEFTLDDARALARRAHAGQVDKQGRDYYDAHLAPIGESLLHFGAEPSLNRHLAMAGYLHDILEDTDVTVEDLGAAGVPTDVVSAVVSVTRVIKESGRGLRHEPYADLIERARQDPLGRWVKVADNCWNHLGLADLALTDPATAERLDAKYSSAFIRLADGLTPENRLAVDRMVESQRHARALLLSTRDNARA